jgi:hypothetical protein
LFASVEAAPGARSGQRVARRVDSLLARVEALRHLRRLVALPPDRDLSERQWAAIEAELGALARTIETRLRTAARRFEPERGRQAARALFGELAELELRTAEAYAFFDTFMDVLTQRLAPELGHQLKGCDALAADALDRDHPALRLAGEPIVYCNRGFGAAIIRSGVMLSEAGRNPVPLIQLPYARLQEKHNLASLLHETGHEALVRLRIRSRLVRAMRRRLDGQVRPELRDHLARWTLELAPDFWAFGCTGAAQAATVRDVLAVPAPHALSVTHGVHPPPYLRVLFSFHWSRAAYGRGPWDDWEAEWRASYRLADAPAGSRELLRDAERVIARASGVFFEERLGPLGNRPLVDLFDLEAVAPARLAAQMRGQCDDSPRFARLRPAQQLAVFRLLRERSHVSDRRLDRAMTRWLLRLAAARLAARGDT